MDRSANLLVVCSPAARNSRWVNEEVRRFRAAGKADRIFCLVVDGDPASSGDDGCFPAALVEPLANGGPALEPLAADVRPGKDQPTDAKLKLIAGLLDLPFDTLKRRDQARRQKILVGIASISVALLAIMTALTVFALVSRQDALRQRDTAQRTVGFLRDLFDGARPDSAAGREVTVREMVDRAAISTARSNELRQEPAVRANLLTTLADVYAKLQMPGAGIRLIDEANRFPIEDTETQLYRTAVKANLLVISGDFKALPPVLADGFRMVDQEPRFKSGPGIQLLLYRAMLAQHEGRLDEAEVEYGRARSAALSAAPPNRVLAATALLSSAMAAIDRSDFGQAEARLRQVVEDYKAMGLPRDPDVLSAYNSLGAIAIKRGDPVKAEAWFRRALTLQELIFGRDSLEVALSRSNLGRALVEQRRFAEAKQSLAPAQAIYLREVGPQSDVLANLEDSLGLALAGLGDGEQARAAFNRGLVAARANEMPKEVELLTDLAELDCATGRADDAQSSLDGARKALARFELPEPWRKARIDNVEGSCLARSGKPAQARALLEASTPLVVERWGERSLFGVAARRRLADVGH